MEPRRVSSSDREFCLEAWPGDSVCATRTAARRPRSNPDTLSKAVLCIREAAGSNVFTIGGQCLANLAAHVRVALYELRGEVREQPQQVVIDEHLAVAAGARADADSGDR